MAKEGKNNHVENLTEEAEEAVQDLKMTTYHFNNALGWIQQWKQVC